MTISEKRQSTSSNDSLWRACLTGTALLLGSVTISSDLPTAYAQETAQERSSSALTISREKTLRNLDRLEALGEQYGRKHAQTSRQYLESLRKVIPGNPQELVKAVDTPDHKDYKLANDAIGTAYYDRLYVFERLAELDPEGPWHAYASEHLPVWLAYIDGAGGTLPGRWSFGSGLALYYRRTGDEKALKALEKLVAHAHYTRDNFPDNSTWAMSVSPIRSREVAYGLRSQIALDTIKAEKNKYHRRSPRIDVLADFALGHLEQWFDKDSTWQVPHEDGQKLGSPVRYVRPFMVALTVEALLDYANTYKDSQEPAVQNRIKKIYSATRGALDAVWDSSWNPTAQAFAYTDRVMDQSNHDYDSLGQDPQPDLNMLLAPLYWRVAQLPDTPPAARKEFAEKSDRILNGAIEGVTEWSWGQTKQFNQQFFHDTVGFIKSRRAALK